MQMGQLTKIARGAFINAPQQKEPSAVMLIAPDQVGKSKLQKLKCGAKPGVVAVKNQ